MVVLGIESSCDDSAAALLRDGRVLASVVSSGSIKARLKYLIARNFFAQRYDYRVEWMHFIDLLSTRDAGEDLKHRAIEGIANVVEAQGGALWLRDGINGDFVPVSVWNMRISSAASEPADSAFVKGFRGGLWIQEFHRGRAYEAFGECWLAVPLAAQNQRFPERQRPNHTNLRPFRDEAVQTGHLHLNLVSPLLRNCQQMPVAGS